MENITGTLLSLRFATHLELTEPRESLLSFSELPEWAPPQASAVVDRYAPAEADHYESWQGISW